MRTPLYKQDLTMDSTLGEVGNKIKNSTSQMAREVINAPKKVFNTISNTSIRDAGEGLLNVATGGGYNNAKTLYNKMKERDGGYDDMMKTPKQPKLPDGVGNDISVSRRGSSTTDAPVDSKPSKKQYLKDQDYTQALNEGLVEALSERVSKPKKKSMTKTSGKLKKKKALPGRRKKPQVKPVNEMQGIYGVNPDVKSKK